MAVWLVITPPDGDAWSVPVTGSEFMIGRDRACDLVLDDDRASRFHARLDHDGRTMALTDLGSTNGVFLNGAVVDDQSIVALGDVLTVGGHGIRVQATIPGEEST